MNKCEITLILSCSFQKVTSFEVLLPVAANSFANSNHILSVGVCFNLELYNENSLNFLN